MDGVKKNNAIYWTATILFLLPTIASAILYLRGVPMVVVGFKMLGYPLYLPKILGVAKLLGAVAIFTGRSALLKEWAYAGFTFDLIGAAISHLASGQPNAAATPMVLWVIMLVSYRYWKMSAVTENKSSGIEATPNRSLGLNRSA